MANQYVNKVIFGNDTLIDLTGDTVVASDVLRGKTFHGKDGAPTSGTCDFDADTSDGTASADEILSGEKAYVNGNAIVGTMPNRGAVSGTISDKNTPYQIQNGYHDGSGTVDIDATEKAKLIAGNIKSGVTILGVLGDYSGEGVTAQSKTATPYTTQQTILPDAGYDYLSQVTVSAIAYTETPNAQGGLTATIGTVAPTP